MKPLKSLIIGTGLTGQSMMRFLKHHQLAFDVFDTRSTLSNLSTLKQAYPTSDFYLADVAQIDWQSYHQLLVSPGLAPQSAILQLAGQHDLPIKGDLQLFAEYCQQGQIVAITGTNGKSTVTALVGHILASLGFNTCVAGNIGLPMLDALMSEQPDYWVLELSSFQLHYQTSFAASVGCILNLSDDHLDWHGSFEAYKQDKHRIYQHAKKCVFNADDLNTYPSHQQQGQYGFAIDANSKAKFTASGGLVCIAGVKPFEVTNASLAGSHNLQNVLAALALVDALGLDVAKAVDAVTTFKGLPHRTERVRELNQVIWINDSKGTNVGAALAAIIGLGESLSGKIVWIAGGQGKGADFSPLAVAVQQYVKQAILLGEDKNTLAEVVPNTIPVSFADSLAQAITLAKASSQPGDCVLLSPACASFDMFESYVRRGEQFQQLVHQL